MQALKQYFSSFIHENASNTITPDLEEMVDWIDDTLDDSFDLNDKFNSNDKSSNDSNDNIESGSENELVGGNFQIISKSNLSCFACG